MERLDEPGPNAPLTRGYALKGDGLRATKPEPSHFGATVSSNHAWARRAR